MGSENSFWNTIRDNMKEFWEADRVENPVNPGTPDVYFTLKSNGRMGWIELKHVHEWPKRSTTPLKIDHFTTQQRSFFRRHGKIGGNVYMMLKVDRDVFLLNWKSALLIGEMTRDQMFYESVSFWKNHVDWEELHFLLK